MTIYGGLDVGGTTIRAAAFTEQGDKVCEKIIPVPQSFESFVEGCQYLAQFLDEESGEKVSIGIAFPGPIFQDTGTVDAANLRFLTGHPLRDALEAKLGRKVKMANDANCLVLAEATDGAGQGYRTVFGLVVGTGVGGGYVCYGHLIEGANGYAAEIGHLPLPFAGPEDGLGVLCRCGQNCLEKHISGPALARLYFERTGQAAEPPEIAAAAKAGDQEAQATLNQYFESFAKGMVTILASFDPQVIVLSGGLINLPGLFDEIPARWNKYSYVKDPQTAFVPAIHGELACVRGAAWLWRAV